MAEKILTTKQSLAIRNEINNQIKELDKLLSPNIFRGMTTEDKNDLFRKARLIMNKISDNASLLINKIPLNDIFRHRYEEIRQVLINQDFKLGRLTEKSPIEIKQMKASYFHSITENQKAMEYSYKQKIDIIDRVMKTHVSKTAEVYKPRVTLLQFNNAKFDTIAKSNGFKAVVNDTEKKMINLIKDARTQGLSYNETFNKAKGIVSEVFPDVVVQSPRRLKSGKYTVWKQNIDVYTDNWLSDMSVRASNEATASAMLRAGADIIQVTRQGDYTCPTCNRIIQQGKYGIGLYSLTGETDGFPILVSVSPFHTRCDCLINPAPRKHQRRIDPTKKKIEEIKEDITSKESQKEIADKANEINKKQGEP